MKKLAIIIDGQNDFIVGALPAKNGYTAAANIANFIEEWDGDIIATLDTHFKNTYFNTNEGKHLPILHTVYGTVGWKIDNLISYSLEQKPLDKVQYWMKETFGDYTLAEYINEHGYDYIVIMGFCTDICVVSNALILKSYLPEATIIVKKDGCAGSTAEAHEAALLVMKNCQIEVE